MDMVNPRKDSRQKKVALVAIAAFHMALPLQAEQKGETVKPENGMYLLWSMGDLVKSRSPYADHKILEHEWTYELIGGLVMNSSPVDNLRLTVNLEIATYNNYPRKAPQGEGEITQKTYFDPYIEEAKGVFNFGREMPRAFEFEFGYFLMRYNSNARVFGEYLFRTMVYPALVFNNFDYPWVPLSGLRVGHDLSRFYHHDLFLLTEFKHYPLFDFSLAYQGSLNLGILEVGAGVNFQRLIPVRPSFTTPKVPENTYAVIPAQNPVPRRDSAGNIIDTLTIAPQSGFLDGKGKFPAVEQSLIDPNTGRLYSGIRSEQTVYSFQGTILMGRLAFFPLYFMERPLLKKLVSMYSEAALLGVENYTYFYDNRSERVPVMMGLQLAWPKVLDVLALEVEHFGSKAVPSFYHRGRFNVPQPGSKYDPRIDNPAAQAAEDERLTRDDWKWIVYARKQFKGLALTMQVGTDHMRRVTEEFGIPYDEILTRPSQWYWQMRVRIPY